MLVRGKADTPAETASADTPKPDETPPVIEVYTLGGAEDGFWRVQMDSLGKHYPRCRYAGRLPLPASAYYAPRRRYLADSLLAYLGTRHTKDNIVVGLTRADISVCNFRGCENYGIMGKTNSIGGGVRVLSNYRKKSDSGLFLLMRHELGHAFGLRHCAGADCLMRNAEGTDLKRTALCGKCDAFMKKKGWK